MCVCIITPEISIKTPSAGFDPATQELSPWMFPTTPRQLTMCGKTENTKLKLKKKKNKQTKKKKKERKKERRNNQTHILNLHINFYFHPYQHDEFQ